MHESQQKAEHVLNAAAVRIPRGLDGCEIVWIVIISLAYKQNSRALPRSLQSQVENWMIGFPNEIGHRIMTMHSVTTSCMSPLMSFVTKKTARA
jgi:hypothetical protein